MQQEILISLQSKAQSKSFSSLKNRLRFSFYSGERYKPRTFGNTVLNYMTTGTHNGLLITIIHFSLAKDSLSYRIKWEKNLIIKANDEDSLISFLVPKLIKLSKHSQSQYLQKISHFPLFLRVGVENPVCTTDLHDSFISRLLNRWS